MIITSTQALVLQSGSFQHFVILLGRQVVEEKVDRVDLRPILYYLIVQVVSGRKSRASHLAYHVAAFYPLARHHGDIRQMTIQSFEPIAVVHNYCDAITAQFRASASHLYRTVACCIHRGAQLGSQVYARVHAAIV